MIRARLAGPEDERALRELAALPIPGKITLSFPHEPNYFAAESGKGESPRILVATDSDNGRILGCGLRTEKNVYWDGAPLRVGYLGSLRVFPDNKNPFTMVRGYRFLEELHRKSPCPVYFTTIMRDNTYAQSLLTGKRANLPQYNPHGFFRTFAATARALRKLRTGPFRIRTGTELNREQVRAFYRKHAPEFQLFPQMDAPLERTEVLDTLIGVERTHGGTLAACASLRDLGNFRQIRVLDYARTIHWVRPVLNQILHAFRYPALPPKGALLPHRFLGYWLVGNNDPEAFASLLNAAGKQLADDELLLFALHEKHPLFSDAMKLPAWRYDSILHTVSWDGEEHAFSRPAHLELCEV